MQPTRQAYVEAATRRARFEGCVPDRLSHVFRHPCLVGHLRFSLVAAEIGLPNSYPISMEK